jgi:glycosyltransferase involved in cell wall biosynthesis
MIGSQLADEENVSVSYITGDFGQPAQKVVGKIRLIRSVKVAQQSIGSAFGSLWRYYNAFRQANADIYIASGAGYEIGLFAFFCRLFGKRFIYRTASLVDCNGVWAREHGLQGVLYEWGLHRADQIVTCAASHGSLLLDQSSKLSSHYIPSIYRPFPITTKAEPSDILWVSTCYPLKRPEVVVQLAQALPDKTITMIMPKSDHFADYYEQVMTQIRQQPNIHYIDQVPVNEIDAHYAAGKLFINTSEYEGFPIALLQALTQGTPPVFLAVNPDNILTEHELGIWAQDDVATFTAEIKNVLSDPQRLTQYGAACRQYIARHHDPKTVGKLWQEQLKELV